MVGKWTGNYTYFSKRLREEVRNRETKFEIEILVYDGIHFSGIVRDDLATGGMKGEGKIIGKIKNGKLEFVKEMPIQTIYMHDGSEIQEEKPHRKIYYRGVLSGKQMQGTWKFKFGMGIINHQLVIFPRSTGSWQMTKNDM
jgi:hypothetical protein